VPPPSLLEEEQILSGAIQLLPLEAEDKPETELGDGVAQLVSATYGVDHKRRKSHMFRARVVTEAAPNPDSRIVLGEDLDAFGQRRIELSWNLTELDTKTLRAHLEVATRELGRTLAGRIRGLQGPWTQHIKPGQHHMGTTRMAEDPASGVVDAHCRVHGIDNLWIAGSSVFPTSGFANPTLTLVALALRLADHLKTELAP
jgi:choline dehydrogenase-like flavoprotein